MCCDHNAGSRARCSDASNDPTPMGVMSDNGRGSLSATGRNQRFDVRLQDDAIGLQFALGGMHVDFILPLLLRNLEAASDCSAGSVRLHRNGVRSAEGCKGTAASTVVDGEEYERT